MKLRVMNEETIHAIKALSIASSLVRGMSSLYLITDK